jgi:hypothetical protein
MSNKQVVTECRQLGASGSMSNGDIDSACSGLPAGRSFGLFWIAWPAGLFFKNNGIGVGSEFGEDPGDIRHHFIRSADIKRPGEIRPFSY